MCFFFQFVSHCFDHFPPNSTSNQEHMHVQSLSVSVSPTNFASVLGQQLSTKLRTKKLGSFNTNLKELGDLFVSIVDVCKVLML